jgi:hypothetical protein
MLGKNMRRIIISAVIVILLIIIVATFLLTRSTHSLSALTIVININPAVSFSSMNLTIKITGVDSGKSLVYLYNKTGVYPNENLSILQNPVYSKPIVVVKNFVLPAGLYSISALYSYKNNPQNGNAFIYNVSRNYTIYVLTNESIEIG